MLHLLNLVSHRYALRCAAALLAAGLSACGGGGAATPAALVSQADTANLCENPRVGINPATNAAYADRQGSLALEKAWVGAFSNNTYLWYSELPDLKADSFLTPLAYFDKLKTSAKTPSGRGKDQFHFTYPSSVWHDLSISGASVDYGISFSFASRNVPRAATVAVVEVSSNANLKGIKRGMKLLTVDGIDFVNATAQFQIDMINQAIYPTSVGESHTFVFQTNSGTLSTSLQAANITRTPVSQAKNFLTSTGKVGYLQFDSHIVSAQTPLVNAFTQFKNEGINDLVLDLRYNRGGYLDMAAQVAYMIAPTSKTNGRVFELAEFNDKNPFGFAAADLITPFHARMINYSSWTYGTELPNLGLNRVYVLATGSTASASESIINGLRGVGVEVIIIGANTTGKPYGFFPKDNCGTTYFTIQFKGTNQMGFGDYADGFAPHCAVADDLTMPMGDEREKMLAQALHYRLYGTCNSSYASATSKNLTPFKPSTAADIVDTRVSTALRGERWLRKP
jgi:carboxyl-terminal processing protease